MLSRNSHVLVHSVRWVFEVARIPPSRNDDASVSGDRDGVSPFTGVTVTPSFVAFGPRALPTSEEAKRT